MTDSVQSKGFQDYSHYNVLFMHSGDSWIRGSENVLLNIFSRIDRRIFTPYLLCNQEILKKEAEHRGVHTVLSNVPEIMFDGKRSKVPVLKWAKFVRTLVQEIKLHKIDLVYSNCGSPSQAGYYAVKHMHIPIISCLHSTYNFRYILMYRLHRLQKVIFVSHTVMSEMEGRLEKYGLRFKGDCRVIYNGVDVEKYHPVENRERSQGPLFFDPETVVMGQVGSLIHRKGVDILLRAFKIVRGMHRNAHLVLVGEGPKKDELRNMAETLGIAKHVTFYGYSPSPDIFINTSLT